MKEKRSLRSATPPSRGPWVASIPEGVTFSERDEQRSAIEYLLRRNGKRGSPDSFAASFKHNSLYAGYHACAQLPYYVSTMSKYHTSSMYDACSPILFPIRTTAGLSHANQNCTYDAEEMGCHHRPDASAMQSADSCFQQTALEDARCPRKQLS